MRLIGLFILVIVLTLSGCSSAPIDFECKPHREKNKYCLLLLGRNSVFSGTRCNNDELDEKSVKIDDPNIANDINQTLILASSKGYVCTLVTSEEQFTKAVDEIIKKSNEETQLLVAMSGEGDERGFIFNLVAIGERHLVPPGKRLLAKQAIAHLSMVKGTKAVVVSACQSGCFVEAARQDPEFKGVVIAACPVGYATTQCNHTGTTALYAGFLGIYQGDCKAIKNLATECISAGFWFENLRHRISDIGAGGLPISYDVVRYSNAEFLF